MVVVRLALSLRVNSVRLFLRLIQRRPRMATAASSTGALPGPLSPSPGGGDDPRSGRGDWVWSARHSVKLPGVVRFGGVIQNSWRGNGHTMWWSLSTMAKPPTRTIDSAKLVPSQVSFISLPRGGVAPSAFPIAQRIRTASVSDPHTQIVTGLEQLVMLTRARFVDRTPRTWST